ncbi:response regulator transcription factor [Novosphingobium sp.]|uniref:response regulator n=1 Tax=Novosphingobium sp. TaxID=1874826 RepID=UPI001EC94DD9|nr:response regulator transcription factor [Novosphingobium sp.]MBK6801987.1 response regulator transcription factor [Novosphingobium sp.]MBK9010197.1 response regulator transcription factor [Novosphingobium sp.]
MTRIAIADDHAFFRSGLNSALLAMGHEVVASVASGELALVAVRDEQPDLLLLDVRMKTMGGAEVLARLREANSRIPVIALTAELTNDDLIALMKARVDGIVFKYEPESVLRDAIETVTTGEKFISKDLMEKAFAILLNGSPSDSGLDALSDQELRIARAVATGMRNRDIGQSMGITEGTVKVHLHKIFKKLNISTRTELAVLLSGRDG